jgi:hypothetical protein
VAVKYQVEKEVVLRDTEAFIQDMLAKELIEVVE